MADTDAVVPLISTTTAQQQRRFAERLVDKTIKWVWKAPLWCLYRFGPTWMGGWHGLDDPEICSRLTRVPAPTWDSTEELRTQCRDLIDKDFASLHVGLAVSAYLLCLTMCVWTVGQALAGFAGHAVRQRLWLPALFSGKKRESPAPPPKRPRSAFPFFRDDGDKGRKIVEQNF